MDTAVLDRLRSERDDARELAIRMAEADGFDPSADEFVTQENRARDLDARVARLAGLMGLAADADKVDATLARASRERPADSTALDTRSLGERFTDSDVFRAWMGHGTSGRFEGPGILQTRAPILTPDVGIPSQFLGFSGPPTVQAPLLSLMQNVPVSIGSVEWIYYPTSTTPVAPVVPEGQLKPETAFAPELRSAALDTYAHHLEYSRQLRDDAPALISIINGALAKGVVDGVEAGAATVINGELGFLDATVPAGGTLMESIRVGVGLVQANGYTPTAVALNPADYAQIDIDILNGTMNGPVVNNTIWGVPAVPIGAIPVGTAYVGDWATAMWLFNRGTVDVFTTDSHADNFTKNIFTVIAEQRAKPVVVRPEAVAKCGVAPAAASGGGGGRK